MGKPGTGGIVQSLHQCLRHGLSILWAENPIQAHYWSINSKCCMKRGLKCSMAPNRNVCYQFVIQYTQILSHTCQYIPTDTQYITQHFSLYRPLGSGQHVLCLIHVNTYPIHTNTYQNKCLYFHAGRKPVCGTEIRYIPLHTKYMPLHANTYHDTYQIHSIAHHTRSVPSLPGGYADRGT